MVVYDGCLSGHNISISFSTVSLDMSLVFSRALEARDVMSPMPFAGAMS